MEQTQFTFDFEERLAFSTGARARTDLDSIRQMLPGCVAVVESDTLTEQRQGIDYKAQLRGGAIVYIDAKARDAGCSQWWTRGPELALEVWSVMPTPDTPGKTGWTLDESKVTDLVLFTFDRADTDRIYLIAFQHLRMALRRFLPEWTRSHKIGEQPNNGYRSSCVFVPAETVLDAISDVSQRAVPAA